MEPSSEFSPDTHRPTPWQDWAKTLRLHQWAKNLLIGVPFLADHQFRTWHQIALFATAFIAMGLVASATYLWNDLLDVDFDRKHPSKSKRLIASGKIAPAHAKGVSACLMVAGFATAFSLKPLFALLLGGYLALTLAYSFHFKRVPLADIFALSFLYLSRVVAGVVVAETKVSFWLFSFTFLLFFSLAAVKRFVELRQAERGAALIPGRGYRGDDLELLSELGIASGVASVVVLGLYSNSEQVVTLYRHPGWFWGVCVVAFYWISRTWLLTRRGHMHDDPVVFALKDRVTWLLGLIALVCILLARPL